MVNDYTLSKAFWLLKKYSSYTWAAEIHRLFTQFVNDLEAWMRTNPPDASGFEEDVLRNVWYMQDRADDGLDLLKNSQDKARAYALLSNGFSFGHLFWSDRWFIERDPINLVSLGFSEDWTKECTGVRHGQPQCCIP